MATRVRTGVRVEGVVQGVGFRPFVYALARRLGLAGVVGNDSGGVFIEVEGGPVAIAEFLTALDTDRPPLARIERIRTTELPPHGGSGFAIAASAAGGVRATLVSVDTATCADCLREMHDPADRRYRYPFVNCTNCGPRFTIVRDVPYDRPLTTMAPFEMCARCAAEYHDPADRRYHAQPTCCPACGPTLRLDDSGGEPLPGDPIATAARLLAAGEVLAVKGLGGYHLAVDATVGQAAATLRARKHREDKPFAVMVADLAAARRLAAVTEADAALLQSPRRPIVLLPRCAGTAGVGPDTDTAASSDVSAVAPAVAPDNRQLGVMLPYTPLHHLLLAAVAHPVVLTSGNVSDEPIAYRDDDAAARLAGIADAFLRHDRAIHVRTDDSVARTFRGAAMLLRRSRGYVPEPVTLREAVPRPVLACGAELKNTFCLAKDHRAFVSHHIGDLENAETLHSFTEGIGHFARLFDIQPQVVAHDLHPEYLSTKYALDLDGVDLCGVQHHHAHVASCLADNEEAGPVIGVAFDGTGYGIDGTIWGGEFLLAELAGFRRIGHLAPVPMPGGAAAIRQPWRMAAAYLDAAYPGGPPDGLDVVRRNERQWRHVVALARKRINAPLTSSAGRLFDAVGAILGVRDAINYEGQAAVELEQLADPTEAGGYRARIATGAPTGADNRAGGVFEAWTVPDATAGAHAGPGPTDEPFQVLGGDLVAAAAEDLAGGAAPPAIAARFHRGVAAAVEQGCLMARDRHGVATVALSGGVFQNVLLLTQTVDRLAERGFRVLVHGRVPCNDGGISLGQAAVAAARDRQANT